MFELHSPVLLLALVAPLVKATRVVLWVSTFCVAVALSYVFYLVWDGWPFARFLLPALPLLLLLVSVTLLWAIARLPNSWRGAALLAVCALLIPWDVNVATQKGAFGVKRAEERYRTIAQRLEHALPLRSVLLSVGHSGSLRWHGNLLTIRWDLIPDDRLDATVALLQSKGYLPYIVVEDWEAPLFEQHFARASALGRLDWPPAFAYQAAGGVRVYCVADRSRFLSGEPIATRSIEEPAATIDATRADGAAR